MRHQLRGAAYFFVANSPMNTYSLKPTITDPLSAQSRAAIACHHRSFISVEN